MDDTAAPRNRGGGRVLSLLGVLLIVVAIVGFVTHFVTAAHPLTLGLTAVSPYLMVAGGLGALLLFAVGRQWMGALVAVAALAAAAGLQAHLWVASTAPHGGPDLVVMTANLRLGEADPGQVVAAVRRDHVDVLMVQELTEAESAALGRAGLDGTLPHRVVAPRPEGGGTGLWSRYPLSDERRPSRFSFATVTARVAIHGMRARPTLVAMHMSGPVPDSSFWKRDMGRLPAFLRALPDDAPVLVGGDFNATTDTPQFRDALGAGYADAADQAGAGYPRTWPANRWYPPVIAIDHVLTRDAVGVAAHTVSIARTDHRALLSVVRMRD